MAIAPIEGLHRCIRPGATGLAFALINSQIIEGKRAKALPFHNGRACFFELRVCGLPGWLNGGFKVGQTRSRAPTCPAIRVMV